MRMIVFPSSLLLPQRTTAWALSQSTSPSLPLLAVHRAVHHDVVGRALHLPGGGLPGHGRYEPSLRHRLPHDHRALPAQGRQPTGDST